MKISDEYFNENGRIELPESHETEGPVFTITVPDFNALGFLIANPPKFFNQPPDSLALNDPRLEVISLFQANDNDEQIDDNGNEEEVEGEDNEKPGEDNPPDIQLKLFERYNKLQKGFTKSAHGGGGDKKIGPNDLFSSRTVPDGKKCDLKVTFNKVSRHGMGRTVLDSKKPKNKDGSWNVIHIPDKWCIHARITITTSTPPFDAVVAGSVVQVVFDNKNKPIDIHWRAIAPMLGGTHGNASKVIGNPKIYNYFGHIDKVKNKLSAETGNPKSAKYYHAILVLVKDALPNYLYQCKIIAPI